MPELSVVLKQILACPGQAPAASLPRELDRLFDQLATAKGRGQGAIEERIWTLWTEHPDPMAAERMVRAIAAMAQKRLPEAEAELDLLVGQRPEWAEAWNKRATLLWMLGRHEESVADIARTLALEPRHFGAICGFGQICLAQGRRVEALAAFETALRIHPGLEAVKGAVKALSEAGRGRMN
jgi:tetratricopeptide (TPR) repeat protein